MRLVVLGMALALLNTTLMAEDSPKVRELDTKNLKFVPPRGGKATDPAVIASKEDLAKSPVVGAAAAAIAKQVDFAKENVVVFAWAGSGQDKVAPPSEVKEKTATFTYTRGFTRDLRQHVKVFAVPKEAEVKVYIGKK